MISSIMAVVAGLGRATALSEHILANEGRSPACLLTHHPQNCVTAHSAPFLPPDPRLVPYIPTRYRPSSPTSSSSSSSEPRSKPFCWTAEKLARSRLSRRTSNSCSPTVCLGE
jgi:hypothetical protein